MARRATLRASDADREQIAERLRKATGGRPPARRGARGAPRGDVHRPHLRRARRRGGRPPGVTVPPARAASFAGPHPGPHRRAVPPRPGHPVADARRGGDRGHAVLGLGLAADRGLVRLRPRTPSLRGLVPPLALHRQPLAGPPRPRAATLDLDGRPEPPRPVQGPRRPPRRLRRGASRGLPAAGPAPPPRPQQRLEGVRPPLRGGPGGLRGDRAPAPAQPGPRARAPPPPTDPDLERRLADLERDLREKARAARERAQRAAREAAAAAKPKRASDEELGYIKTDDTFGKILADARPGDHRPARACARGAGQGQGGRSARRGRRGAQGRALGQGQPGPG